MSIFVRWTVSSDPHVNQKCEGYTAELGQTHTLPDACGVRCQSFNQINVTRSHTAQYWFVCSGEFRFVILH